MRVKGGDKVKLNNGKVVVVNDIKNDEILVSYVERYKISDIAEIIERLA